MKETANVELDFSLAELEGARLLFEQVASLQSASLEEYYNASTCGFRHRYDDDPSRTTISKSSTATCILSLVACDRWEAGPWRDRVDETVKRLLTEEKTSAGLSANNPFTTGFILEAVTALDAYCDLEKWAREISECEEILHGSLKRGFIALDDYPASSYLTQIAVRALKKRQVLTEDEQRTVSAWAFQELTLHVSLYLAGSRSFDNYELLYCVLLLYECKSDVLLLPDRKRVIRKAVDIFFDCQLPTGTWPPGRPLFHYPKAGNAHCHEYETLVQLLNCDELTPLLLKYLRNFVQAGRALKDYAYIFPSGGMGWPSGHHAQFKGPESWPTASVFHFCHASGRLIAEAIRQALFRHIEAPYARPGSGAAQAEFARTFWDAELHAPGGKKSLRETLFKRFVEPVAKEAHRVRAGRALSSTTPVSAIFFGPPGTSKTELCKLIAEYLRWPLLSVDPSYFVKDGLDKIQAQADNLFKALEALEETVVLFDEFDEMVRTRSDTEEPFSRFLTTSMLPRLARLNTTRRILLIVATNYIGKFDIAIKRPGRFDVILQVMPPSFEEKMKNATKAQKKLQDMELLEDAQVRKWIADFTFGEWKRCQKVILSHEGSSTSLSRNIEEMAKTCTLQSLDGETPDKVKSWSDHCKGQEQYIRFEEFV